MNAIHGTFELPDRNVSCRLRREMLLSDAAVQAGLLLNISCGGKGSCGQCAVQLVSGQFTSADGKPVATPGRALACQTRVGLADFVVRVPRHALVETGEKIVMDFAGTPAVSLRPPVRKEHLKLDPPTLQDQRGDMERIADALRRHGYDNGPIRASVYVARQAAAVAPANFDVTVTATRDEDSWHVVRVEPGDTSGNLYGAAVDIGTTTVVVALVNLKTGKLLDAASSYNQQIARADDVASRISYACDATRLAELRDLVVEGTINRLLTLLCSRHDLNKLDISHMVVSGNSVMSHLFCGMSPTGLGGVPFAPITNTPGPYRAGQLHVAMNPEGFVDIMPAAAAYVGGDITADAFVCGIHQKKELTALIDIGTNAEIIVGNHDRAIACAAPAGPAFEGYGLTCGMRAATGAIETFELDAVAAEPRYAVIGGGKPSGVCGSGLIDFIAAAYKAGLISMAGRFTDEALAGCPRIGKLRQGEAEHLAYTIAPAEATEDGAEPIRITQRDIAALLQAKGVIFAALQIVLKHYGKSFDQIDHFVLAGGFAKHINLDSAVAIGMLPDLDRRKYAFIGNGSLGGAVLTLIDGQIRQQLPHLAAAPNVIELNLDPEFMDAYTMAMLLP